MATLTGCATRDYVTGKTTLNRYSIADDVDIGTRQATLVLAATEALGRRTDPDDVHTRTVRAVAARILSLPENRARMPPFPWEFHTVDDGETNAWCFPGGQVVLLTGLMRRGVVRNEDEVAAVLGHEMAHAAARHATEGRTIAGFREVLRPFGTFFGPRLVELAAPDAAREVMAAIGASASRYAHDQEIEADVIGIELMARAGYDPAAAAAMWKRLARDNDLQRGDSHPSHERRERELDAHLPVAHYVARRTKSAVPAWLGRTDWRWTEGETSTVTRSLGSQGPLPRGAKVGSYYVRNRRSVLDIRSRIFAGPSGEAMRASVTVGAARDLWEDGLPLTAGLYVERRGRAKKLMFARRLSRRAPLDRSLTKMRVALPPLPPGAYVLRTRAVVGSLWTESVARFDVLGEAEAAVAATAAVTQEPRVKRSNMSKLTAEAATTARRLP